MIYLNNAATTQQKPEGVKHAEPVTADFAKSTVAKFLGVRSPENVFFTQGGAQAMELALRALIGRGDHVIATVLEQDGTWAVLEDLAAAGAEISSVGVNAYGVLRYEDIEPLIRENTRAIVCAHGCAVTGNITDLEKVGGLARRHGLLLISDGCQAVGATDVNLDSLSVDVYCFTAHKKLMGPHGVGGLCLKDGIREDFLADLDRLTGSAAGAAAAALDTCAAPAAGTNPAAPDTCTTSAASTNPATCANPSTAGDGGSAHSRAAEILAAAEPDAEKLGGLCAALDFIMEKGIYGISIFPHRLAKRFFESVSSMDAVKVYGNFGTGNRIPTVSIAVEGFSPAQVREHLAKKFGIVVKDGLHDAARMHQALGTADTGLTRFSFGYFNTRRDVNDTVWALMDLIGLDDLYLLS